MAITYDVLSDEELNANRPIIQEGQYRFECYNAEQTISKSSGNEMMKIGLKLYDSLGNVYPLTDYIVFTKNSLWKFRAFCASVGRDDIYKKGNVDSYDFMNKSGSLKVKIGKDSKGNDSPKVDYLPASEKIDINHLKSANTNKPINTISDQGGYGNPADSVDPEFFNDVPF